MPLRRFRRQYEQLSQFERGRNIGMMESGWSARRVARQLGRSDCVVRRCWNQWIRESSFTSRPSRGYLRQTSHRENCHIVRNTLVQPTASSAAIQAQVAPSLGSLVSSRTIRRCLAEGHLGRPHREHLNPAFALQRRTAPTAGVMVWRAIAYNTWSPIVLIRGTMIAQRYVHDIVFSA
ncbi:transposable element Tcb2 transposase [Trichonephila clavipes]|nr:transposable element Tcb2 transposase [Trichonephila clavipes]